MDLRPGGAFRTLMRMEDGSEFPTSGVFLEVVAPARIVFTDAFEPGWQPSGHAFMTAVTTFAEEHGQTRYAARTLHWTTADLKVHAEMALHPGRAENTERSAHQGTKVKAGGSRPATTKTT